ncbi:MAG: hypothetical protein JF612_10520 [Planctomycetia bacterium]|nr:hypothetical protein [Planctomycetia bacterium]
MKAFSQWFGALFVAFCIGTVISLAVIAGMLWWKGVISDERIYGMLAALQGIKPPPPPKLTALDTDAEQPSFEQILNARLRASLDLDLRESAIDKALGDLRTIETALKSESSRLDLWKQSFDKRLADLQSAATEASLREVQQTLEAIQPKQAKDQLIKMLAESKTAATDPLEDVVRILKAVQLDKRKKILAEFKTPEEIEKFHEILRNIRIGGSDTELLQETRKQLQQQSGMP